jgi:hypothetical protein
MNNFKPTNNDFDNTPKFLNDDDKQHIDHPLFSSNILSSTFRLTIYLYCSQSKEEVLEGFSGFSGFSGFNHIRSLEPFKPTVALLVFCDKLEELKLAPDAEL